MNLKLVSAAAVLCFASVAHADDYLFSFTSSNATTFSGDPLGPHTLTFVLPSTPVPVLSDFSAFAVANTSITLDGVVIPDVQLSFGADIPTFGGVSGFCAISQDPLCVDSQDDFVLNTKAVFTGSTDQPVFVKGVYAVDSGVLGSLDFDGGALTISGYQPSSPSSVTPEPSTIALLGTGMAGLLGAARRRFRHSESGEQLA